MIDKHGVDVSDMENLKQGKDIRLEDGTLIANAELTLSPELPKSYAFCSDTAYKSDLAALVAGVSCLYHEATFLDNHQDLAVKTKHSTAKEAAKVAAEARLLGARSSETERGKREKPPKTTANNELHAPEFGRC